MNQAAPAANHNNDSTPRALSSRVRRLDDAGLGLMIWTVLLRRGPLYGPLGASTRLPERWAEDFVEIELRTLKDDPSTS